jgi:hypothetical protein
MAFTRKYLQRVAEGERVSVRDWLLDVRMPWPEDHLEPEPPHGRSPIADCEIFEQGGSRRSGPLPASS